MEEIEGFREISEALAIAWRVYEQGWIREQPTSPQIVYLGEEVQKLVDNLSNVVRIVENARLCYQQHAVRSPHFRGFFVQKSWDLSSFHEICGRFKAAICECEALLVQNRDVYRSEATAYGDEWLLVTKPKVDDILTRLVSHNHKLSIVLKPLEIKLLGDIQHEFANQPQPLHVRNARPGLAIQGLVVGNLEQALLEYRQVQAVRLDISPDIEAQLRRQLEESRSEMRFPGQVQLQPGNDLFLEYFDAGTISFVPGNFISERQPTAKQYLNLLKALLILLQLQQSQELKQVHQDSLWPLFVTELTTIMRLECQRFQSRAADRLIVPDAGSLQRALKGPRDRTGSKEDVSKLMSPHFETYSKPIMSIPLPSPQIGLQRHLTISRVDKTKLRLVEAVHEENSLSNLVGEIVMDIDLANVQLTPIYATPSSRPRPLEVLLQTQLGQLNPSFCEIKHIYRLQHLLTGYKVYDRYDQAMIKVSFFTAGQRQSLEEHGRMQLWLPQPFTPPEKSETAGSKAPSIVSRSTRDNSHRPVPTEPAPTPARPVERRSSFRKWIPGFRKAAELSAQQVRPSEVSHGRASSQSSNATSFQTSSAAALGGYPVVAASGPFELPAPNQSSLHIPAASGMNRADAGLYSSNPSYGQNVYGERYGYDSGQQESRTHQYIRTPSTHGSAYRSPSAGSMRGYASPSDEHYRTPSNDNQVWPYSPNSLLATSPWQDEPQTNHRYTPSASTASIYSEHHVPPSTTKPRAAAAGSSPSVMSTRSTRSHSSMGSSVSTIKTSTVSSSVSSGGVARMHHRPRRPMLILFLKDRTQAARLSIVAVEIDGNTSVVRERCDCHNSHSSCRISCVERSSGNGLLAQRWDADGGLTSFNVAKAGEYQRKTGQDAWHDLRRISLRFEKMEDRYRFAGSACACKVRTTHELSRCNLQSHNGVFGIVKQIGDQMLLNYHNERNTAMTKPMVLAPLAENEL